MYVCMYVVLYFIISVDKQSINSDKHNQKSVSRYQLNESGTLHHTNKYYLGPGTVLARSSPPNVWGLKTLTCKGREAAEHFRFCVHIDQNNIKK